MVEFYMSLWVKLYLPGRCQIGRELQRCWGAWDVVEQRFWRGRACELLTSGR